MALDQMDDMIRTMPLVPTENLSVGAEHSAAIAPPAVLLVDDHDLFRAGLRTLLEGQDVRVVGDSRCDGSALEMARRTRANIILLDTSTVDGASTASLVRRFAELDPEIGVLLFTRSNEPADVYSCLRAGARGYLAKGQPVDVLCSAIAAVRAGHGWLQPETVARVLEFIRTGNLPIVTHRDMSEREIEVLRLLANGLENNEIAERLEISGKTVKNHVSNILTKLEMTNRVQAAVYAVRTGIA